MTVAELIKQLKEMPGDLIVYSHHTDPDGAVTKSEADVEWVGGNPDYVLVTG